MTPADWDQGFEIHQGATFNLAHNLGQMLHLRPRNRFEDLDGVYLVGGGTHPGSGLPVIFQSALITSRLMLQDLGVQSPPPGGLAEASGRAGVSIRGGDVDDGHAVRHPRAAAAGVSSSREGPEALDVKKLAAAARAAQAVWSARPVAERLRTLRALRHLLAARAGELIEAAGRPEAEVLSSEVIPLGRRLPFPGARGAAHPRSPPAGSRGPAGLALRGGGRGPARAAGARAGARPLELPALPARGPGAPGARRRQRRALEAGARGARAAAQALRRARRRGRARPAAAGRPPRGSRGRARGDLAAGVDKVLLTGSAATGREVLAELASRLVPATMELSGCDALFVLPGADLERVAQAVRFGLALHGGATCIAPRRVFVPWALAADLGEGIAALATRLPAVTVDPETARRARVLVAGALEGGARLLAGSFTLADEIAPLVVADALPEMRLLQEDLFAPVVSLVSVADGEEALADAARCPYALGPRSSAPRRRRSRSPPGRAGVVVVNDVIVPTADPRLPFGGRGESGFGVTRGDEGLLELTVAQGRRGPAGEAPPPSRRAASRGRGAFPCLSHPGSRRRLAGTPPGPLRLARVPRPERSGSGRPREE